MNEPIPKTQLVPPIQVKKKKRKKKKPRCFKCSKKLTLVERELICRCNEKFCNLHFFYQNHDCRFNWKSLVEEMPKVCSQVLQKV